MGNCGCGGGGAATTTVPHTQARTGQRPSCPVEECGCDTCVRIRIVQYLPWLSASDIAVGAHIPGGAMVIPELPEREPDLTPPWMWLWWEDGGGTGVEAPANREEGHASSEKAYNPDTGEVTGGSGMGGADEEEEEEQPPGASSLEYWENKKAHMDDPYGTPRTTESSAARSSSPSPSPCWPLPWSVDMWHIADLGKVCEINLGPSVAFPRITVDPTAAWPDGLYYKLPYGYVPTRSKKEMREYCIPEWENPRKVSWSTLAAKITVGPMETFPGLYWSDHPGFYHGALKYALATMHTFAEFLENPTVLSTPCNLTAEQVRADIEDPYPYVFTILADNTEIASYFGFELHPTTGLLTIEGASKSMKAGAVKIDLNEDNTTGKSPFAFTVAGVIRFNHHKALNAAVADYYFWWAWRLYSYGMDTGDDKALVMAKLAAKAALSEICEIASLLSHEYSHVAGGSWEDTEPVGGCVNCCHYLTGWTFLNQLLAANAAPFPMMWQDSVTQSGDVQPRWGASAPRDRFDLEAGDGWRIDKRWFTGADGCSDQTLKATFCSFWEPGRQTAVSWNIGLNQPDDLFGNPYESCWTEIDGIESDGGQSFPAGFGCSRP